MCETALMKKLDLPPVWLLLCALVAWAISLVLPLYSFHVNRWFIGVLVVIGVLLVVWAGIWFRLSKTPIEPRQTPETLVSKGPYRLNRNPIYTGMTIILLALALYLGEISALIAVFAYPIIITLRFIRAEEQTLLHNFGEEAQRYFSRSRRW